MFKKISSMLICILILLPTIVFADESSYGKISGVSNVVLNVLSGIGYFIACRYVIMDRCKIRTLFSK